MFLKLSRVFRIFWYDGRSCSACCVGRTRDCSSFSRHHHYFISQVFFKFVLHAIWLLTWNAIWSWKSITYLLLLSQRKTSALFMPLCKESFICAWMSAIYWNKPANLSNIWQRFLETLCTDLLPYLHYSQQLFKGHIDKTSVLLNSFDGTRIHNIRTACEFCNFELETVVSTVQYCIGFCKNGVQYNESLLEERGCTAALVVNKHRKQFWKTGYVQDKESWSSCVYMAIYRTLR